MAEEMGTGIYCGGDLWDRSRSMPLVSPSSAPFCMTGVFDDIYTGNFDRSISYCSGNIKSRSSRETSSDSPTRVFGSDLKIGPADFPITGPSLALIWNHGSNGTADENDNVDTILQEDMDSSQIQDWSPKSFPSNGILDDDSSGNAFKHINQELSNNLDQSGPAKCTSPPCQQGFSTNTFAFGYSPSSIIQSFMEPQEITGNHSSMMNYQSSLFKTLFENKSQAMGTGLFPFSSNASPGQLVTFPAASSPSQLAMPLVSEKVACHNDLVMKLSNEDARDTASVVKEGEYEPVYKRPRIDAPLPTFKVRKEKLGDRVTALQQLVSPFGKTDTASVLHEAVGYIKFLHDQLTGLITQHLKNGASIHNQHQNSFNVTRRLRNSKMGKSLSKT
ncbi:hypothetical protein CDL15_Pgr017019 [Punica granatum]|uniref:BHLH domain-containing protein n=1 Tax=Punica granatum TaxID=22663 RepID=A0A218WZG6_PUNGR|nr:hypothetical protein CDL15_Pgr017019 [Punica granatum]